MHFATFNSKPPSAALGVVTGYLDGTDRILVAFNCLTRIVIFEQTPATGELVFLNDIPLYCSLKYMKVVPIVDNAAPRRTVRHLLFLLSMKQEIVLATLDHPQRRNDGTVNDHGEGTGNALHLVTLYHSGFTDCSHQFNPGEVNLACATDDHSPLPLVAFSVNRGDIYFLDVFAALATRDSSSLDSRKRKKTQTDWLRGLFPASVVSAAEARSSVPPVSRTSFDFTEYDVKDIAFEAMTASHRDNALKGFSSSGPPVGDSGNMSTLLESASASADTGTHTSLVHGTSVNPAMQGHASAAAIALFVLFADRHGRCHVSQYMYSTAVTISVPSSSATMFPFSRDVLCDASARAVRKGTLQTNVDPSATCLCVTVSGLFILGNHLVTYIALRPNRRRPVTCELPPSPSGTAVLACACSCAGSITDAPTLTGSAVSSSTVPSALREDALMVCFSDGVCARISVNVATETATPSVSTTATAVAPATTDSFGADVSNLSSGLHAPRLNIQFFLHVLPTSPTSMAIVTARFWVVASQFGDSLLLDLHTGATAVVLKNCGPILGMEVVRDGPRTSVVASTGVNGNGGVSLVRSAATFREEAVLELPSHVVSVHTSHHLIALTMRDSGPRFFFAVDATSASIRNVTSRMPPALLGNRNGILDMSSHTIEGSSTIVYAIATRHGLFALEADTPGTADGAASGVSIKMTATSPFSHEALFASICDRMCAVAGDKPRIHLYRNTSQSVATVDVPLAVSRLSALHLATDELLLYGDWIQESVHILRLSRQGDGGVLSSFSVRMPSVPRSLCVLGGRIFAGLLRGQVVEVSAETGVILQQAVISDLPVELCPLPGHTDSLLCRGPVPLLLLVKDSFQVTGLSTTAATSCSTMALSPCSSRRKNQTLHSSPGTRRRLPLSRAGGGGVGGGGAVGRAPPSGGGGGQHSHSHSMPGDNDLSHAGDEEDNDLERNVDAGGTETTTVVIWSQEENELLLGSVKQTQKLNQTFLGLGGTVTHIADFPQWEVFAVSVRRPEKDEVVLVPHSFVSNSGLIASPLVTPSAEDSLLENERCVFFEPLRLSVGDGHGNAVTTNLTPQSTAPSDDPAISLLVGSTFAFPDEQRARSSRIAWFRCTSLCGTTAASTSSSAAPIGLQLVGEKDISGALQCCCVVPNYPGRIALGVSGCILTFHWSSVDGTFIAEERCHVGLSLTKLVPLPSPVMPWAVSSAVSLPASLVALDARHSATYVHVDPVQGSIKVVGRDAKVRGVVDGTWITSTAEGHAAVASDSTGHNSRGGLCMADDSLNFFYVEYRQVERSRGDRAAEGDGQDNDATAAPPARACVVTAAQAHIGDLITCLCPGSFAPSIMSGSALAPSTLVKGIVGDQMVYGTAHGGFGTIAPLSDVTYLFLRSLEAALRRTESTSPTGFQHSMFRDILVTGQERGVSRNASFEVPLLQKITETKRREEAARGCVDGGYAENFLNLTPAVQNKVLRVAEVYLLGWSRPLLAKEPTSHSIPICWDQVDSDTLPSDMPFPDGSRVVPPAPVDELLSEACNSLLAGDDLPLLPLTIPDVCAFLRALQWVH